MGARITSAHIEIARDVHIALDMGQTDRGGDLNSVAADLAATAVPVLLEEAELRTGGASGLPADRRMVTSFRAVATTATLRFFLC